MAIGFGEEALDHLIRVNALEKAEGVAMYEKAMNVWRGRNRKEWRIAVANHLLNQYPQLCALIKATNYEDRAGARPSQVTEVYWVEAVRKKGGYPSPTAKSGKWLIFVKADEVDRVWGKFKKAVENGKLGNRAKVATAKPNPRARTSERRVICVYTYNYSDKEDVMRIRQELRKLGIAERITYKADEDTLAGKYRISGHRRIGKYYE